MIEGDWVITVANMVSWKSIVPKFCFIVVIRTEILISAYFEMKK